MLGFHGLSVTPISALEEQGAAPAESPTGWQRPATSAFATVVIAAAIFKSVTWTPQEIVQPFVAPPTGWQQPVKSAQLIAPKSAVQNFVWAPNPPPAATPTEFGFYQPFGSRTTEKLKPAAIGPVNVFPEVRSFGWYVSLPTSSVAPLRQGGNVVWTPQAPSAAASTPSELGWYRAWEAGFSDKLKPVQSVFWSPQAFAVAAPTPTELGFYQQFGAKAVDRLKPSLGSVFNVFPEAQQSFGWFASWNSGPLIEIAPAGQVSWVPQGPTAAATPSEIGWFRAWPMATSAAILPAPSVFWAPQAFAAPAVTTDDFGWYQPWQIVIGQQPAEAQSNVWTPQEITDVVPVVVDTTDSHDGKPRILDENRLDRERQAREDKDRQWRDNLKNIVRKVSERVLYPERADAPKADTVKARKSVAIDIRNLLRDQNIEARLSEIEAAILGLMRDKERLETLRLKQLAEDEILILLLLS